MVMGTWGSSGDSDQPRPLAHTAVVGAGSAAVLAVAVGAIRTDGRDALGA